MLIIVIALILFLILYFLNKNSKSKFIKIKTIENFSTLNKEEISKKMLNLLSSLLEETTKFYNKLKNDILLKEYFEAQTKTENQIEHFQTCKKTNFLVNDMEDTFNKIKIISKQLIESLKYFDFMNLLVHIGKVPLLVVELNSLIVMLTRSGIMYYTQAYVYEYLIFINGIVQEMMKIYKSIVQSNNDILNMIFSS